MPDRIRIEIGFDAGQGFSALVESSAADELERSLASGSDGTFSLDADDARYVVALRRVVFLKRYARESRVGFGAG